MPSLIALLLTALSGSALACQAPTPDSLRAAWIAVRAAALQDDPGASARLYKFPLLLLSPFDGDRPLRVTRTAFNDNYVDLFGAEIQFRQELKKTRWLAQSIYMPEAYGLFKDGVTDGIR